MLDNDVLDDAPIVWTERASLGMVDIANPRDIPDAASALLYDADLRVPGERKSRPGVTSVYDSPGYGSEMRGIAAWNLKTKGGTYNYLLVAAGNTVRKWNQTAWTSLTGSLGGTQMIQFVEALDGSGNDVMYILGGSSQYSIVNASTALVTEAGIPGGNIGCWCQQRLFVANNDTIYFSDPLAPTTFGVSSKFLADPGAHGAITGLIPWDDFTILVFKERAILSLRCAGATPLTDWDLTLLSPDFGCVSRDAIVRAGRDVWFLAEDGIRSVSRTVTNAETPGTISPISYPLSTTTAGLAWTNAPTHAFGTYYDRMLIFSVPKTKAKYAAEQCLVMFDNPNPELRTWSVWTGTPFGAFATMLNNSTGKRELYANSDYYKDPTGTYQDVVRMDSGVGTTEGSTALTYLQQTKAYNLGPMRRLRPFYVEVVCRQIAANGGTLTLSTQKDENGSWTSQGTLSLSGTATDGLLALKVPLETLGPCRSLRLQMEWTGATAGTLSILEHSLVATAEPIDRQI